MATIVGIGDSLMLNGNFVEPFATRMGWTPTNKGVSGETTTQIAARFNADVVALAPTYCLINGGINDIGLGTVTQAQFLTNWGNMLSACQSNGIIAIAILITPRTTSNTDVQAADTDTWNAALTAQIAGAAYASNTKVINLRPRFGQWRSTGPATNKWDYRPNLSTDGVHLNAGGAVIAGEELQNQFTGLVPTVARMSDFRRLFIGDMLGAMGVAAPVAQNFAFVNSTDQAEVIFQVPDDAGSGSITISRLGYMLATITGVTPVMEIRLETVGTDGNPSGTLAAAGSNATFTPAGAATFFWQNLTTPYTANRGDWLAWVIKYSSGTINASNRPTFTYSFNNVNLTHPYSIGNVATVRSRLTSGIPVWGFGSTGKAFGFPAQSVTNTGFSTTAERALRFLVPVGSCGSFKVIGVRFQGTIPAAAKSTKLILYSGTTALQTVTWDSDFAGTNANVRPTALYFQDATLTTLRPGTEYRIGVQPQDATNNVSLMQFDFNAAADLEALSGGADWYLSTRASGGATAWTDVLTSRPWMALIIGEVTPPPLRQPALSGGLGG